MSRARYASSAVAAIALAVSISACGAQAMPPTHSSSSSASEQRTPKAARIVISGYAYQPAKISVAPGARITFTNRDQTPHTATGTKSGFDTGSVKPGQSKTITVSSPGTYTYYCQFHAFMHGTLVVR